MFLMTLICFRMYRIRETAIQKRVSSRIYLKKPICLSKGSNFVSVGFLDCYGAFMIFGIGLGSSYLIFLFEILWKKYLSAENNVISEKCRQIKNRKERRFTRNPHFEVKFLDKNFFLENLYE